MDRQAGGPGDGPGANTADVGTRRYRSLASRLGDGLFRLDADERFVDVDDDFADLTGRTREDLLETPASAVFSLEDTDRFAEAIRAGHETGEDGRMRLTVDADGTRRPAECRFDVVETEAGREVAGIVDVTERKRLEAELDEVFGRVSDAFFALDEDWTFTYLNERAHELINPEGRRLEGKDVWAEFPDAIGRMFKEKYERAMHEQETVAFEEYYPDPLDRWFEVRAYPSETGLSVYFRDVTDRKEREQELEQYETIVETVPDGAYVLDEDHRFVVVNETFAEMTGYDREELLGRDAEIVSTDEGHERGMELRRRLREGDIEVAELEERIKPSDGTPFDVEIRFTALRDDDGNFRGTAGAVRDVTERKEYEQRLQALNRLNKVVRDISDAVIEQSTRDEIEQIACERLAESDSYEFAWVGETDSATQSIERRAMAGVDGYLDDVTVSVDADEAEGEGPTGRALRTGEIQTLQHVREAPESDPWRGIAEEYGFRASAAIPIRHEDTVFGVLNVYTGRPDGFEREERTVVDHLGEILGHAIASAQRKQALMSDTVVELELGVPDVVDDLRVDIDRLEVDRAVPIGDDAFLVYGRAESLADVEALGEGLDYWEEATTIDEESDPVRFQVRLSEPPMLSAIASVGGSIESAVVTDGDYRMTVHLPESADVRTVIDTVQDVYPQADALARRQISASEESAQQVTDAWMEKLTDRQLTAIEVAYFSGFFEWPRGSSGEEVAEALGVSSPTFHQHVRRAERKLLDVVLSETSSKKRPTE